MLSKSFNVCSKANYAIHNLYSEFDKTNKTFGDSMTIDFECFQAITSYFIPQPSPFVVWGVAVELSTSICRYLISCSSNDQTKANYDHLLEVETSTRTL